MEKIKHNKIRVYHIQYFLYFLDRNTYKSLIHLHQLLNSFNLLNQRKKTLTACNGPIISFKTTIMSDLFLIGNRNACPVIKLEKLRKKALYQIKKKSKKQRKSPCKIFLTFQNKKWRKATVTKNPLHLIECLT